jgi:hypothetical protein
MRSQKRRANSQQPGVSGRDRAGLFGGEDHLMPGIAQQPPWHRDLGDVEVPVGKRNQHAHAAIIAARIGPEPQTVNDAP